MFRSTLVCLSLAFAATATATEFEPERVLRTDAAGLESMRMDTGAGSLVVQGDPDSDQIEVRALLWIEDHPRDLDRTREVLDRHVELALTTDGDRARLTARTRDPGLGYSHPHVDLVVTLPSRLDLDIDDRSGSVEIRDVSGDLMIRDDSGSIELAGVDGRIVIEELT